MGPETPAPPESSGEAVCNAGAGTVTVWSDIGCPWGTLALHTLHVRAREEGRRLRIDHRAFPLELFNRMPTPKHILDAEIVAIAGCVPELGWRAWIPPDSTYPVTTLPSLEAVQAAKAPEVGGLVASDELDTRLRAAFFLEGRCISLRHVILEAAADCDNVNVDALAAALSRGAGASAVHEQWQTATGPEIRGSPHVFAPGGYARHNPGATYRWTARPGLGFPRLEEYCPAWADELLSLLAAGS